VVSNHHSHPYFLKYIFTRSTPTGDDCTKVSCRSGEPSVSPLSLLIRDRHAAPPRSSLCFACQPPSQPRGNHRHQQRQDDPRRRQRKDVKPRVNAKAEQKCARHSANSRSATISLLRIANFSFLFTPPASKSICISTSAFGAALFSVFGRTQGQGSGYGYLLVGKTNSRSLPKPFS
jgi:hypothetical protein